MLHIKVNWGRKIVDYLKFWATQNLLRALKILRNWKLYFSLWCLLSQHPLLYTFIGCAGAQVPMSTKYLYAGCIVTSARLLYNSTQRTRIARLNCIHLPSYTHVKCISLELLRHVRQDALKWRRILVQGWKIEESVQRRAFFLSY